MPVPWKSDMPVPWKSDMRRSPGRASGVAATCARMSRPHLQDPTERLLLCLLCRVQFGDQLPQPSAAVAVEALAFGNQVECRRHLGRVRHLLEKVCGKSNVDGTLAG
eukprot:321587-Chlamydomonas_euryale.AAC.1